MGQTKPRILVVDDDADVCTAVAAVLEDEGFEVATAHNGKLAAQLLEELFQKGAKPAVILLDLMMPVMNGWQFWDWLKARPHFAEIPVAVFTATGLRRDSVGNAPVVQKPVDVDKLVSLLARLAGAPPMTGGAR